MTLAPTKLPPGPKGRYLVGNLLDYSRDPLDFLTRCAREYGDVVRLKFPGPPAYLLAHPNHIERVLVGNNRNFIKDRVTRSQREAVEDCEIGGFHVPAETQLFISQYVVHHDPRFFEDPDSFDPDRWTGGLEKRIPKYAYFSFGGGPRLCIGQSFAKMEAALLLATIARRFRIRVSEDQRVAPQPSITLRPKQGIQVKLEER